MKKSRSVQVIFLLVTISTILFGGESFAVNEVGTFTAIIATDINGNPAHVDGNTSKVTLKLNPQEEITVRWLYVDAPEIGRSDKTGCNGQPYGVEAINALSHQLPAGSKVTIHAKGKDMYGRTLAEVYHSGTNMNLWMLRNGHAVTPNGWKVPKIFSEAVGIAQSEKIGIWKLEKYESPGIYRRRCDIPNWQ